MQSKGNQQFQKREKVACVRIKIICQIQKQWMRISYEEKLLKLEVIICSGKSSETEHKHIQTYTHSYISHTQRQFSETRT